MFQMYCEQSEHAGRCLHLPSKLSELQMNRDGLKESTLNVHACSVLISLLVDEILRNRFTVRAKLFLRNCHANFMPWLIHLFIPFDLICFMSIFRKTEISLLHPHPQECEKNFKSAPPFYRYRATIYYSEVLSL